MTARKKQEIPGVAAEEIAVTGAREHNLKNISLRLPRRRLIVVTGPSGSGKSSLAFDTVYAEGQRRFVETLFSYARQYLDLLPKADVDQISGLSPSVAIEQRTFVSGPRSTLGTTSEVFDYLRLLFARTGVRHCLKCGDPVTRKSPDEIVRGVLALAPGQRCCLLAPVVRRRKGEYGKVLEDARRDGFVKVRVDGKYHDLDADIKIARYRIHRIEVVVDQFVTGQVAQERLSRSVLRALDLGENEVIAHALPPGEQEWFYSAAHACPRCGVGYEELTPMQFSFNSPAGACPECTGLGADEDGVVCPACAGARLRPESLAVRVDGRSIADFCRMPLSRLHEVLKNLPWTEVEQKVAVEVIKELRDRTSFLVDIGLGYLTLDRPNDSLSGGEFQRVRLATQIGSGLSGVLYVLDEPSIGLHARDALRLIGSLRSLVARGNTVVVVEHDEAMIRSADHVVDLGPGAGVHGGELVASGPVADIEASPRSLTGKYLRGDLAVERPAGPARAAVRGRAVQVLGASEHNLKNIDVEFPLGLFICVTGVSGSGKSTLVDDILRPGLEKLLYKSKEPAGKHRAVRGAEHLDKLCVVDQSPIGRTPRSNPVTYTGIFSVIRDLFSRVPESRARGYGPGRFSFNVRGGRCEACEGNGSIKVEMNFLPDVFVPCGVCEGRRYNDATLEIRYKDLNIAQVLALTIEEAAKFFADIPPIREKLDVFAGLGLGYLTLGQSATTLSGGEAQRLKLAHELVRRATGRTLYLLDEPTTGLHFADVHLLLDVLHRLVGQSNTVVVIEHNLEVIKTADHVIDLGPEGGEEGGRVVYEGPPAGLVRCKNSHTGQALKSLFEKRAG